MRSLASPVQPGGAMIQMVLHTVAPDGRERESYQSLRTLMRPLLAAGDDVRCLVLVDAADARHFYYIEEWRDPESLRRELRSPRFRGLVSLMDASASEPTLLFRTLGDSRGLDLVAEVRAETAAEDLTRSSPPRKP